MYLASLSINNFRRIRSATIEFEPGLNIIVGPNNIGKTAVVDALRSLLAGTDDPYPRFSIDDVHLPKGGAATGDIVFDYIFKELSLDDEADFLHGLRVDTAGKAEAVLRVTYGDADKSGRLRSRKVCGIHHDIAMTATMLENLRSVYLQPLRDAELGLRPSRSSQLSRLMHLLSDDAGKDEIARKLADLDNEIKALKSVVETQEAITGRHKSMLGNQLAQMLAVELSGSDFTKFASRLSLLVDSFEIERNGLGYNNLIFMAVVLSELAKNADSAYRSLIVEEPEAHLHPQLQAVLLRYLSDIKVAEGERPVQVFVTSHSPNFVSIADLDAVECLVETGASVDVFHPRSVSFGKGKKEKLKRYLDVTRAEIFFARRVIFVEGAAELLMIDLMAKKMNYDLRNHGVSLISVEGLNFDSFLPLFGETAIKIPVAVITDADPVIISADGKTHAHYPSENEHITLSSNTESMKRREDAFVKVFYGQKTFEYDFALHEKNRTAMLAALKDLHPQIGAALEKEVKSKAGDRDKAKALFRGMFERSSNNVQKGAFAQALAEQVEDNELEIEIPTYIGDAVKHACKP
ncbi:DNA replication and repair protein RecF [Ascidiaceihabitans donghaensis]|uniref:DNA replication and repair protein RecF n=1 Tax=Ascidiaceihabitans donghaensis TaxID=1510460 RepID=A0A2R8BDC5_9RHOB|nr:ATP-dependent endonuclease [Ascidiaceihabitans donghaensis]SPH21022.1 DNA replication and repair protein RecF [Ascidiaceihabitans donghaensis]